jgi:2',3'-cyclic-nucleotide 2'-phosphodiesterase (5'-nucleotidase family)
MGYDVMTLGTGDLSLLTLEELQQRAAEAEFPILSANAYVAETEELVAEPFVRLEMGDHHVAILGLTDSSAVEGVSVADPLKVARDWVPQLRKMADIVILLSHAGVEADHVIAKEVKGIDVIVSGRVKPLGSAVVVPETGTLILHSNSPSTISAGIRIGVAYLSFDGLGRLTSHQWENVVLDSEVDESKEMLEWLREMRASK